MHNYMCCLITDESVQDIFQLCNQCYIQSTIKNTTSWAAALFA